MEVKINAMAHCCYELFPVLNAAVNVGDAVGLFTKDIVSLGVSIHYDNGVGGLRFG